MENELELSWERAQRTPAHRDLQDIHCVTRWSKFDTHFEGVHWRELAQLARPKPSARFAIAHAEQGSPQTSRSRSSSDEHALLATHADGEVLDARARIAAQARDPRQVLLEERQMAARDRAARPIDKPGFWERYGYHNDADPWREGALRLLRSLA